MQRILLRSLAVVGSDSGDTAGGVLQGVCTETLVVSGVMRVQFGVWGEASVRVVRGARGEMWERVRCAG